MRLKQRLDQLEANSPTTNCALAVFITSYESRGSDECNGHSALIVWPGGASLNFGCASDETETAFMERVKTMEGLPFQAAQEQMAGFKSGRES